AVALFVDLSGKDSTGANICTGTPPTTLTLTKDMVDGLLGGTIKTWGDARLRAGGANNSLNTAGCTGAVTRVVRRDSAGPTQISKNYLHNENATVPPASSNLCDGTSYWAGSTGLYQNANNQLWPGLASAGVVVQPNAQGSGGSNNTNCSAIVR